MREILADAAALFQNLFERRRHRGGRGIEFEIGKNPAVQIGDGGEQRRFSAKTLTRIIGQSRRRGQQRRIEDKLIRFHHFRRNRGGKDRESTRLKSSHVRS